MKKIFCAILLFFCFAGYGFAQQTIEYCCTYQYSNGVKVKVSPFFRYITFTDNFNRFYFSDEYGNANNVGANGPFIYKFSCTKSDYNVYVRDYSVYDPITERAERCLAEHHPSFRISTDLSVINAMPSSYHLSAGIELLKRITVYKRVTKAEKEAILREYEESLPKLLQ